MKRPIFPTASKYRRRTRREFGGETVEYIIVILAVVVIGGGLMGFGNQVSGQIGKTGNSISSWFGKANGTGDNASGGNGTGGGNNAGGENKGDENSGSQLQAPTVSVTGIRKPSRTCGNMPPWISRSWKYPSQMTSQMRRIPERAWQNELQEPAMRRVSPVANGSTLLQLKRFSSVAGISRQNHPLNRSAIKEQIS